MLATINSILPKRKKSSGQDDAQKSDKDKSSTDPEQTGLNTSVPVDAMAFDISAMAVSQEPGHSGIPPGQVAAAASTGQEATIIDYSAAVASEGEQKATNQG